MEVNKSDIMIGIIAGEVIAYDILSEQTISERVDEYLEHPIVKYIAIGGIAVLGYHLLNLPEHFNTPDPLTAGIDWLKQWKDTGTN